MNPPLCWETIFGNTLPVEIEIGFGKCGFLIEIATQHPAVNFLGIEVSRKYYRKGIKKIQRANTRNVKLLWGEAFHIFTRYIADNSIASLYINFPDPWPKKRHAKRRLLNAGFVATAARKLSPEGCIEIATDVKAYIYDVMKIFQTIDAYKMVYYTTSKEAKYHRQYRSEYEKEFLEEGKDLHYAKYKKI
jgi:tRNA (guanine-N7-)-methyltransferase